MDEFIGIIKIFAGNFAPTGWALCNGQLMPISQNTALFSILGTTYGGDGIQTFALPDLRGRTAVGMGNGPGLPQVNIGQLAGEAAHTLLTTEIPAHTHTAQANSADATQSGPTAGASLAATVVPGGRGTSPAYGYNTATPNTPLNPQSIVPAGGSQPHNNMQPYLGVNYIICLQGIFPSRS
jgi:microcystin-dependent protein